MTSRTACAKPSGIDPYALWANDTIFEYCRVGYTDAVGQDFVKFIAQATKSLYEVTKWLMPVRGSKPDWIKMAPEYGNSLVFDELKKCKYFTGFIKIQALQALLWSQPKPNPKPLPLTEESEFWKQIRRLQLSADVRAVHPFVRRMPVKVRGAYVPPLQHGADPARANRQAIVDTGHVLVPLPIPISITFSGLIDIGVPFANRECRDWQFNPKPDPPTPRLRAYWDQGDSTTAFPAANPPARPKSADGFEYGREWVELAPPTHGMPPNSDPSVSDLVCNVTNVTLEERRYIEADNPLALRARSHGAATLGELSSNRLTHDQDISRIDSAGFVPLLAVQLPRPTLAHSSLGALSAHVLDGLRWLIARAGRDNRLVANVSLGTQAGPHDGSSILESAIDELIGLRKLDGQVDRLSVVMAAGNSRESRCHANFDINPSNPFELIVRVLPDSRVPVYVEVWLPSNAAVDVRIKTPSKVQVAPVPSLGVGVGGMYFHSVNRKVVAGIYNMDIGHALGKGRMVLVAIASTSDGRAEAGEWTLVLESNSLVKDCHAYVERNNSMFDLSRPRGRQARFVDQNYRVQGLAPGDMVDTPKAVIKRQGTLNSLATGQEVLVVGAYVYKTKLAATYGGSGPTRRGTEIGVDAGAFGDTFRVPKGVRVMATRSGDTTRLNGTSIAAPRLARNIVNYFASHCQPFPAKTFVMQLPTLTVPPAGSDKLRLGIGLLRDFRVLEPRLKYE